MLLSDNAKRLSIFAYFDKDGIVDSYVIYLLQAVRKYCTRQIVVVNGTLTKQSEAAVKQACDEIIYRDNKGFDVTAYKEGFLREDVSDYDEVLFYNQTIFGPVCPLDEMFDTIAQRDVDFWGLTRHKGAKAASWNTDIAIEPHVQSFFFAVRSSMFKSVSFKEYWKNLPEIKTYWDAVGKHEVIFTKHFTDKGFKWDVFINTENLEKYNDYPLMGMPKMLVEKQHCPFIKRKSFVCTRHSYTTYPQGEAPQLLYDFIRTKTNYPIKFINENITRTVPLSIIENALTLYVDTKPSEVASNNTAVVIWCKTDDMLSSICESANEQKSASVFFLAYDEQVKNKILLLNSQADVTVTNGMHGMKYMFETLWNTLEKYKYILYLTNDIPNLLDEFYDATSVNAAIESIGIQNASSLFENREDIGVIIPVNVIHQECATLPNEWKYVCEYVNHKMHEAKINVPIDTNMSGVASRGGMFIARTDALAPLANYSFTDDDFDKLYSPCEYIVPLVAQSKGYLTAYGCSKNIAYLQLANTDAIVQDLFAKIATPTKTRYDKISFRMQAILDFYYERRYQMTLEQAFNAKLSFKEKMWIILQILFKPETFAKLQKAFGHKNTQSTTQFDDLD